jgi:hypothetical protein
MKKLSIVLILLVFTVAKTYACAEVGISGPSEMYINAIDDNKEKATFTATNLEGHVWGTPYLIEWKFVLGTKTGAQVTYDTELMSNLQPGTYTLTCTAYFTIYGGSTQVATKNIKIIDGPKPDLQVAVSGFIPEVFENSSTPIEIAVKNSGDVTSTSTSCNFYYSQSSTLNINDAYYAGSQAIPSLGKYTGSPKFITTNINTPNINFSTGGSENWYLFAVINPNQNILEKNYDNNISPENALVTVKYNSANPNGLLAPKLVTMSKTESLSIFPNPASHNLNISSDLRNITILDQHGNIIKHHNSSTDRIDISNLQDGNYILRGYDSSKNLHLIRFTKK